MTPRSVPAAILVAVILILQSCNQKEELQYLFSGTLPMFEISEGDSIRYTEARSLFITLMNNEVQFEGNSYPIDRLSEDQEQAVFSAGIPLDTELTVTGLTYRKSDHLLLLDIGPLGKQVTLELFDEMIEKKAAAFAEVDLTADISYLSDNQKELLRLLFRVADIMDDIYWAQVFPDRDAALENMGNGDVVKFFKINYGPWERLNGNLNRPDRDTIPLT
jgi:hypothetical protein